MWWLLLLLIPAQAQVNTPQNFTSPCLDQNHIFFVPGVLAAGGSSRACLSRFHPDGQARMIITLVTEDGQRVSASRDLATGDGGCLDLSVPQKPNTKADVNVNVRYIDDNCVWTQRVPVRIAASKVLVVHTERARYRPGEVLRFRVLALKTDLTPVSTAIEEIWLEGPGSWEVKAVQWNRVRTKTGLVQLQHDLDELAPSGKWTLIARLEDGSQGSSTFLVGNYELLPFQLTVRHAAKVLRSSERLSWTVCVRYPWSEAVEGMLVIRIRGAGSSAGIRTAVRLRARPCHRHAAAARRIQLDKMAADDVVVADFSFQEDGTRVWQNTTVVSQVVENPVSLEFLTKHKPVISPGLPYKLKIKATRWDDKPAANELVHVCRSPATSENDARVTNAACVDALTDDSGVARVMFTVEEHATPYYVFEASTRNTHIRLVAHSAVGGARAAFGPLRAARTRSILPLYLRLPAHSNTPVTVHFVVITRGGTIYRWGATTQCPTRDSDQIHTTTRNSICPTLDIPRRSNLIITNSSDLDSLKDFHAAKIMLPLKMSHQMCPDSYLFAYFQYDGELVTASKHFEMEECFTNEVELSWDNRITPPGSTATLTLSTLGPALCALSAIDNAAKWTNPPHELRDEVIQQLRRVIQTHRNITQYDAAGDCFLISDEPFDEATELSASGVRSVGAGAPPRCVRGPQSLIEEVKPRNDFAEAWLWRLLPVGSNGTGVTSAVTPDSVTRYEASAFCLSKTGVAVSQPAVLQVFREFFIHADCPKQLRRGDTTIMRYRLFNYLYESLSVQVTVVSDQSLEVLERTEILCIRARSSIARRLTITARELGEGSLRIRAEPKRGACGNDTTAGSGDEVVIKVKIEPEGVPTNEYKSALLCANTGFGASDETWKWPQVSATPGSESFTVWVTGDLNGPLLADADSLILLPRGCGEQNMQRLAANYLASLLQNSSPNTITTRLHMARGFVRQMQYLHPSGGFSAFGPSDPVPSTWLTAFCVRYLRRIHQTLYPDSPVPDFINRAERWLIDQQMENGCFRNEGQIFHRELRGGIEDDGEIASVTLTAYTISSLMESTTILPYRIIKNSLSCFRALPPAKSKTSSKIYAHSLLAYTLMRLRRYEEELAKMNEASPWEKPSALKDSEEMRELVDLIRVARRSGEFVWWDSGNLATSIEATGYALLALAECPETVQPTCAVDARAAVLWLSTHRSVGGGFVSTQDTLVALEALLRWSTILPSPSNLRVRIQSKHTTEIVNLAPGMTIPNVIKMDISDKLSVTVEGTGCALVQATRSYSSTGTTSRQSLSVDVPVRTDGPFNCDNTTNCYCAAVVDACVIWRGPLPAMSLAELSLPASYAADAGMLYAQLKKTNTLLRRIELSASGGKATLYIGTRDGADTTPRAGHECFKIHVVGPRVKTKPGYVKIYDYYHPEVMDTQTFTIPEDCPAPIDTSRKPKYSSTDNLFNSAKSPDGDEILIIDDFTYEDVPEGIPLDYPAYDNIVKEIERNTSEINVVTRSNENSADNKEIQDVGAIKLNETAQFDEISKSIDDTTAKINRNSVETEIKESNKIVDIKLNEIVTENNVSNAEDNPKSPNNTTKEKDLIREVNKEEIIDVSESHKEEVKTDNIREDIQVDEHEMKNQDIVSTESPHLSNFHEVNYDLEVPSGLEGPVPSVVLPPKDFFVQSDQPLQTHRHFEPLLIPNYVHINQHFIVR